MRPIKYWIAVVSKDHLRRGVTGGFMQVNHGKEAPLKPLQQNDWVVFYSPKIKMDGDEKLQAFTAVGQVADEKVYSFQMTETFIPFRRNIKFYDCKEISILPLIPELEFIQDKKRWGYPFRYGFFEIQEKDFRLIKSQMLPHE